jgi:hypothetical protein
MNGPESEQSSFSNGSAEILPIQALVLKLMSFMDESRCFRCHSKIPESHHYHLRFNEARDAWIEWSEDLSDVNIALKQPTHIETWNWIVDSESQTAELESITFGTRLVPPVGGFLAVGVIDHLGRTLSRKHLKEMSSSTRKLFVDPETQRVALSLLLDRFTKEIKEN